jgi:membrane protease YdiL (CAAX protease family)
LSSDQVPNEQSNPRFWGFWPTFGFGLAIGAAEVLVGVGVGVVFVVMTLVSQPGLDVSELMNRYTESLGTLSSVTTIINAIISVIVTVVLIRARRSITITEYLGLNSLRWKTVLALVAVTAGLMLLSQLFTYLAGRPDSEYDIRLYETGWPPLLWLALVIFAPVSEETLFRGFLFQGLRHSRIGVIATIVLMACIWASLHIQYGFFEISQVFILGLVLGVARWKTDSLWSPLLMHGLWNLVATVQLALTVGGS